MKNRILSAEQIRKTDEFTITNEPIASIDLMERAALQFVHAIVPFVHGKPAIHVFCGSGNNGGDGLAIARMLIGKGCKVFIYCVKLGNSTSPDCQTNMERAGQYKKITAADDLPVIQPDHIIVDALLGTGVSRPVSGLIQQVISHLNASGAKILSVDIPSGLPADGIPENDEIIRAHFTGTFERPKLSFFLKESAIYTGQWQVLPIGLSQEFLSQQESAFHYLTEDFFANILRPRVRFSHKGTYGHGLLIAGSKGKMGSAVLAAKAALRSGMGLLTVDIPECGYTILQTAVPEAMCKTDYTDSHITKVDLDIEQFTAIGIGPGMGVQQGTKTVLEQLFATEDTPLVIDADALNVLAENKELLSAVPPHTILTPHPKEFERLAGKSSDSFERLKLQIDFSVENNCIVVLKDAITSVSFPDGNVYFNTTGNPGMATGGTGDVLTGIITGLLSQGYAPRSAALIAVYFHGKAGDLAAKQLGQSQLIAGDLMNYFRLEI